MSWRGKDLKLSPPFSLSRQGTGGMPLPCRPATAHRQGTTSLTACFAQPILKRLGISQGEEKGKKGKREREGRSRLHPAFSPFYLHTTSAFLVIEMEHPLSAWGSVRSKGRNTEVRKRSTIPHAFDNPALSQRLGGISPHQSIREDARVWAMWPTWGQGPHRDAPAGASTGAGRSALPR